MAGQGVEAARALDSPPKAAERPCRFSSKGAGGNPVVVSLILGEIRDGKALQSLRGCGPEPSGGGGGERQEWREESGLQGAPLPIGKRPLPPPSALGERLKLSSQVMLAAGEMAQSSPPLLPCGHALPSTKQNLGSSHGWGEEQKGQVWSPGQNSPFPVGGHILASP